MHPRLIHWVKERRAGLVTAALTLARDWYAARCPSPGGVPPFGGFQEWANTVGGVLEHAGVTGFLGNRDRFRCRVDEEQEQWETFLRLLQPRMPPDGSRAAEIATYITGSEFYGVLPAELAGVLDRPPAARALPIVKVMKKVAGRRFAEDGLRVERGAIDGHSKSPRWRVVVDQEGEEVPF